MNEEEIKKIINQIEERVTLYLAIKEPVSPDLDKAIKLSLAYEEKEKEKQELIDYLKSQIKHLENLMNKSEVKPYGRELELYENSKLRYLEILDRIEKRNK